MAVPNGQTFPAPSDGEQGAGEPSMEDILASIRRIIASDNIGAPRSASSFKFSDSQDESLVTAAVQSEPPVVLEPVSHFAGAIDRAPVVTTSHGHFPGLDDLGPLVPPPAPVESRAVSESAHNPLLVEPEEVTSEGPGASEPTNVPSKPIYDLQPEHLVEEPSAEPLISSSAGAHVSSSFQALADTMLIRDPEMLERIARDALRPMLKTWLDDNLPSMVERLVRAEIERVARGGR